MDHPNDHIENQQSKAALPFFKCLIQIEFLRRQKFGAINHVGLFLKIFLRHARTWEKAIITFLGANNAAQKVIHFRACQYDSGGGRERRKHISFPALDGAFRSANLNFGPRVCCTHRQGGY